MNKELLYQLYAIHSPSGNEKKMRKYLKRLAKQFGAESAEVDAAGNLLIQKGQSESYPCLAAHMDQVQDFHSKDFQVLECGNDVIGYSPKCHKQQGLGADDKNGIFICLELLQRVDAIKVAFFVGEECGCIGSSRVDLEWFKDCRFIIEPDRKGRCDLITSMYCGEVCSKEFIDAIQYKQFGYKQDHGTITDVGTLTERGVGISCLNLSCGYYDAHSDHEITNIAELENCLNFVEWIVTNCTEVYPFEGAGMDAGFGRHSKGMRRVSDWDWYGYGSSKWSDEDMYYNDGYYDEDYDIMADILKQVPNATFELIKTECIDNFHAAYYLKKRDAENMLKEIYDECKADIPYNDDEFWGEDANTDDLAGELVAVG